MTADPLHERVDKSVRVGRQRRSVGTCAECDRNAVTRGMCSSHYQRWLKATPVAERPPLPKADFWSYVKKSHEHGCWTWTWVRDRKGYGRWRNKLAHRVSWEVRNGPIPDGLYICHTCDNPPCVNPAHLYAGTHEDNTRDAVERGRTERPPQTHCSRGHEKTGDNLAWVRYRGRGGKAYAKCRTCENERGRRNRRKGHAEGRWPWRVREQASDGEIAG